MKLNDLVNVKITKASPLLIEAEKKPDTWIKGKPEKTEVVKDKKLPYGQELILDIHDIDQERVHVEFLKKFAADLCDEIGMQRGPLYEWGSEEELAKYKNPKVDGISVCQFLYESSIVVHCIDELGKIFVNIFSCKKFDAEKAKAFCLKEWGGNIATEHNIIRN